MTRIKTVVTAFIVWAFSLQMAFARPFDRIQTVFVIVMENHDWSTIKGSTFCPYINKTLLPMASYAEQYFSPPGVRPSLPNYLWLEAGSNFGILDDRGPDVNHQQTINHLVSLLQREGISWKTYQESISGKECPVEGRYPYAVRHNPFVYFDDVAANPEYCLNHVRPYLEFSRDLKENKVARYNFITPNLINGMHDTAPDSLSSRQQGDDWLAKEIPKIMASQSYQDRGAIFIVWDEGSSAQRVPIGLIVLSPFAKGRGYSNRLNYTHSSLLRTLQEIFQVRPFLRDANNARDLSDLFLTMYFSGWTTAPNNAINLEIAGISVGKRIALEKSCDFTNWFAVETNSSPKAPLTFEYTVQPSSGAVFFRIREFP